MCNWYDVPCWLGWLVDEIKLLFVWLYEGILNGMIAVIDAVPVPGFLDQVATIQLPQGVIWFAHAFQLPEGFAIVVSAYTLRFLLRRLPFIG